MSPVAITSGAAEVDDDVAVGYGAELTDNLHRLVVDVNGAELRT
jgi:hypothetical protein